LINSKYHAQYCKQSSILGTSFLPMSYSTNSTAFHSFLQDEHSSDAAFYIRFMKETLDTLHALYENLKLNVLRKQ
jgi:anaphase-promoting complex subunit 1